MVCAEASCGCQHPDCVKNVYDVHHLLQTINKLVQCRQSCRWDQRYCWMEFAGNTMIQHESNGDNCNILQILACSKLVLATPGVWLCDCTPESEFTLSASLISRHVGGLILCFPACVCQTESSYCISSCIVYLQLASVKRVHVQVVLCSCTPTSVPSGVWRFLQTSVTTTDAGRLALF